MDSTSTSDLATAREWSRELLGEPSPVDFFLSPPRFVSSERTDHSMSLTLSGEHCFGLGFGPEPPANPSWTRCLIDQSAFGDYLGPLVANDQWDFFCVDTARSSHGSPVEGVSDDGVITEILTNHAPHSQVWPGNEEIVNWYGVRDSKGQWVSLGALVRWESGLHVLASVVTVSDRRGQGLAQLLVRAMVAEARRSHIRWLGLGVAHDNVSAQRVYVRGGFNLRSSFTNYHRPSIT